MLPGSFDKPDRGDVALPDQAVPEHDKIDELKALSQVKEGLSGVGAGQRRSLREGWGTAYRRSLIWRRTVIAPSTVPR